MRIWKRKTFNFLGFYCMFLLNMQKFLLHLFVPFLWPRCGVGFHLFFIHFPIVFLCLQFPLIFCIFVKSTWMLENRFLGPFFDSHFFELKWLRVTVIFNIPMLSFQWQWEGITLMMSLAEIAILWMINNQFWQHILQCILQPERTSICS